MTSDVHFKMSFPRRIVNSIYFDSIGLDAVYDNLSGVSWRDKVRFRWYGETHRPPSGVLEQKIKRGYVGTKKLLDIKNTGNCHTVLDLQKFILKLLKEPQRTHFSKLIPVIKIRYSRQYFTAITNDVRVTIDTDVSYFRLSRNTCFGNERPLHSDEEILMEVKYSEAAEFVVTPLFDKFQPLMSRNSKYTRGMVRRM